MIHKIKRFTIPKGIHFLIAVLGILVQFANAQAITNKGKEFWVGYGHHQYMEPATCGGPAGPNDMNMRIYLSNTESTTATVTITIDSSGPFASTWFRRTYTIPPNTVIETENMPKGTTNASASGSDPAFDARLFTDPPPAGTGGEGIFRKKGIRIVSDNPIVAYAHIYGGVSSGATMLLPIEAWGYSYTSINSEQGGGVTGCYSWMYVIAKEDNTKIEITPSQPTRLGKPAGVPFIVNLMKGQIYQLIGQADCATGAGVQLTGTKVRSLAVSSGVCKPIAVFSGSSRTGGEAGFCGPSGRDNDMQQCFPQQAWGKRYLTAPFSKSSGGTLQASSFQNNVFKILIKEPGTIVKRNGIVLTGLINGTYYAYTSNTADYIEADKPITIAQFMSNGSACNSGDGDPEMVYLSPIEQAIKKVGFYRTNLQAINSNYITLIVPTGGLPTLKIDGGSVFNHTYNHPNKPGYTVVVKGWAAAKAQCLVSCDSGFTAITYGMGGAESYGYNAGTNINNLSAFQGNRTPDTSSISSVHPYIFVNTPTQIGALVAYKPVSIVWRLSGLGCSVVNPCTDLTTTAPPIDSTQIGSAWYYLYRLPGNYTFSQTGTFYLQLDLISTDPGLNDCSNIEKTSIEFVVKDAPTIDYSYTHTVGCTMDSARFTSPSVTPQGYSIIKYKWTFPNGDTSNLQNPAYLFAAGTYQVKLSVLTQFGGIAEVIKTLNILSGGQPNSNFSVNPSTVCLGQPIVCSPLSNYSGTTGWYWDFGNGQTINATSNANQSITYTNAGTYIIKHTLIGSGSSFPCAADTVRKTVIVLTSPVISSTTPNSPTTCGGTNGSIALNGLTATVSYLVNYTYNGAAATPITLSANSSGVVTIPNLSAGTYANITVTVGTCTSAPIASVILNNPNAPTAPAISSNSPICAGAALNLTSGITIAIVTYEWTGPNGFTSNLPNPTINPATTAAAGTYSLVVTNIASGCKSVASTTSVVVNAIPLIGSTSSSNPTTCATATGSITLNGLLSNTPYSVSYTFNAATQTVTISSNGSGQVIISGLAAGAYSNITVALNTCVSTAVGPISLSDPNPPATPVASVLLSPICAGNTINLSATSSTVGATFTWSGPNSFSATGATATVTSATTAASGTYTVLAKLNGCTSLPGTVNVTVNPIPATPTVASNSPICSGSTLNLTSSGVTGTSIYNWTGPNSFTSSNANPTITAATTSATGTYNLTITQNGCTSASSSVSVVVNAIPLIGSTSSSNPTTCATATGSITLNGLLSNTPYSVSYTFNAATQTVTISSNGSGQVIISGLAAGAYSNITVALNTCVSTAVGPISLSDPNPPATPVASVLLSPICAGNTINLSATSSTVGATFTWSGPNSFSATGATATVTSATTAASGTYTVLAKLNGCTSLPGTVNVTVNPIPATPTVASNSPICSGSTLNLTSSGVTGTSIYNWTGPNSFTSSNANPTITAATTSATGTYNLTITQNGCTSASSSVSVVVNAVPIITSSSLTNSTTCASATGTIVLNGLVANTSYTVNYTVAATNQTTTIISGGAGSLVIPNLSAGTYSNISVTLNNCTSNVVGPFTITDPTPPLAPIIVSNNSPVCSGSAIILTAGSTAIGATFTWTTPGGSNVTGPTLTVPSATASDAGTYSVKINLNSCNSSPVTTNVVVKPTPVVSSSSSTNPTTCATATGSIILNGLISSTQYAVAYTKNGVAQTATLNANTSGVVTIANLSAATYDNVTLTLNGCTSSAVGPFVLSDPNPPATPTILSVPSATICSGNNLTLTANTTTAGTIVYNWSANNGFTPATTNPLSLNNVTLAVAGTYSVTASLNGCTSVAGQVTVVVNPTPVITNGVVSNPTDCASTTGSIALNGLSNNTTYTVNYTINATIQTVTLTSNALGALIIPNLSAGTYSNISVTFNGCPSNVVGPFTLTDPAAPGVLIVTNNSPLCEGATLNIVASSSATGVSFSWTSTNGYSSVGNTVTINPVSTSSSGTYTVTAIKNNCPSTATAVVSVKPYPVTAFTTSPFVCMPNGVVSFTNLTTVPDGSTPTYVWDFGDGSPVDNSTNPTHIYTISNTYNISLTATGGNGCSKTISKPFDKFYDKPLASFKVDKDTLCLGPTSMFKDLSSAPNSTIKSWLWDFADGTTSTTQDPQKKFNLPGSYMVRLIVRSQENCVSDTSKKQIKVYQQPIIDAGPSFAVQVGTSIVFNPTANDSSVVSFLWTPSSHFVKADTLRPTLTVRGNQTYYLKAKGEWNCTATDSLKVIALKVLKIPNAFTPNGDNIHDKWEIDELKDFPFVEVEVFNRNGHLVYHSTGYSNPWDGTLNGKPLPVGTYYYIIDLKNNFPKQAGSVTILK